MLLPALLLVVFGAAAAPAASLREKPRHYKTNSKRVEGMVNVHIIPHTHDDVGEEASRAQPRPTSRSSPHPAAPKRKTSNRPFPPKTVPRRVA